MYFKDPRTIVISLLSAILIASISFFIGYRSGRNASFYTQDYDGIAQTYAPDGPYLALVLDDCGYSKRNLNTIRDLGAPVTLAVLPGTPYAGYVSDFAQENDIETIVHMPMEPVGKNVALEKETITVGMSPLEIESAIDYALSKVPSAKGVNNHMGSRFTADEEGMSSVMSVLAAKDLYFLDSLTTGSSVCEAAAGKYGVPFIVRDVFLDNSPKKEDISAKMNKIDQILSSGRSVVAIGHDRTNTVAVLKEYLPNFQDKGYTLVSLSELIEREKKQ